MTDPVRSQKDILINFLIIIHLIYLFVCIYSLIFYCFLLLTSHIPTKVKNPKLLLEDLHQFLDNDSTYDLKVKISKEDLKVGAIDMLNVVAENDLRYLLSLSLFNHLIINQLNQLVKQ